MGRQPDSSDKLFALARANGYKKEGMGWYVGLSFLDEMEWEIPAHPIKLLI
jgi:hypothetical protein